MLFAGLIISAQISADGLGDNFDKVLDERVMRQEWLDPETTGEWPSNANGDLPMAGIFYGNHQTGVGAQNAGIGVMSSRRFRAEKTGQLEYVSYHNRVLLRRNITDRCKASGPGSVWCNCVDAGLDEYTCGYTLGSSYHVGNGGRIVVELRPDDGTGLPASEVLASTVAFVPMDYPKVPFPKLAFTSAAYVELGNIYHLVFTNLNPPTSCSLTSVPASEAARCPRNQGAIGLNGVRFLSSPSTTGLRGPYRGNVSAANFYKRSVNSSWREYTTSLSWFEIGYTDGTSVGESYSALDSMGGAQRSISGNDTVRQSFTVEDSTRIVDGIWVNFGHKRSANGESLVAVLKDRHGSKLATGRIKPSEYCMGRVQDTSVHLSGWCRDWGYAKFPHSVELTQQSSYSLELSTASGGGYLISGFEPLTLHGMKNRNQWGSARAEFSSNGGASWSRWGGMTAFKRDLPVLFTIEGMPRQLH